MIRKYCNNDSVRIVVTSFKIGTYFLTKDQIPVSLRSNLVCKFKCANCSVSYIGETSRHIKSRIEEHTQKDKLSQVYRHLHENEACFASYNNDCLSILVSVNTKYQLYLKEGMYIGWENSELNRQIKHASTTLWLSRFPRYISILFSLVIVSLARNVFR